MTKDDKEFFYNLMVSIDGGIKLLGDRIDSHLMIHEICQDMGNGNLRILNIKKIIQTPEGLYIEVQ